MTWWTKTVGVRSFNPIMAGHCTPLASGLLTCIGLKFLGRNLLKFQTVPGKEVTNVMATALRLSAFNLVLTLKGGWCWGTLRTGYCECLTLFPLAWLGTEDCSISGILQIALCCWWLPDIWCAERHPVIIVVWWHLGVTYIWPKPVNTLCKLTGLSVGRLDSESLTSALCFLSIDLRLPMIWPSFSIGCIWGTMDEN